MDLEAGDLVLCTVERVEKTIVFLKIPIGNKELDGTLVISEVAPGRIRNIRAYVVPKKQIVCKILRISQNRNIEVSLRRVSPKEQKEVLEEVRQEKSYEKIIKSVLGEEAKQVIKKIKETQKLYDFIKEIKEEPKKLEKILGKEKSKKVLDILTEQKQKSAIMKKEISFSSHEPNGLDIIKEILGKIKDAEVSYISAGKYGLKIEAEDMKTADKKLQEVFSKISESIKKSSVSFSHK
ncbi:MAG: hypothetical protein WDZ77_01100 [Candidatus Pacearchaeota archaeon]